MITWYAWDEKRRHGGRHIDARCVKVEVEVKVKVDAKVEVKWGCRWR